MARTAGQEGVPLTTILNLNFRAIREDLGDLEPLKASMRNEGLKVPILLTPDFRIIDGARRLQAAYELGWEAIPAIATNAWDTIVDIFQRSLEAEEKGYPFLPMRWMETFDQRQLLRESYKLGPGVRRNRGEARPKVKGYTLLDVDLDGLLRLDTSQLTGLVNVRRYLTEIHDKRPELYERAVQHLHEAQDSGATTWTHSKLRHWAEGKFVATDLTSPDIKEAKQQVTMLTRGVNVLDTVGYELDSVGNLNAAISMEDAKALSNKIRQAMNSINRVRNRLKLIAHLDDTQQERE